MLERPPDSHRRVPAPPRSSTEAYAIRTQPVTPNAGSRSGPADPAYADILRQVNRAHGASWALVHRLPGGYRSGAYLVRDDDGREAVLKYSPDPSWARHVVGTAPLIAEARRGGWPTPAWVAVGVTESGHLYHLQERVDGASPERLTAPMARQVLPILDWQRGRAPDTDQDWSAHDHAVVFAGKSGLLKAIDEYSPAGHALASAVPRRARGRRRGLDPRRP